MHYSFLDLDREIEKKQKMKIARIVEKQGWDFFRNLEYEMVKKISNLKNHVIATGGGAPIFERNAQILKENGVIVFLLAEIKTIAERIKNKNTRPALTGKKSFIEELEDVWRERKEKYFSIADKIVNIENKSLLEIVEEIIE